MPISISYEIPGAIAGQAAFAGGFGDYAKWREQMRLQRQRMVQDDIQQQRSMAFQAAQQQAAQQADMLQQQIGQGFQAQRDMFGAQQDAQRFAAQQDFQREAANNAFAQDAAMRQAHDDATALREGKAYYPPPLKARRSALEADLASIDTNPAMGPPQRAAAKARIAQELMQIRPVYRSEDEIPKSPEEMVDSSIVFSKKLGKHVLINTRGGDPHFEVVEDPLEDDRLRIQQEMEQQRVEAENKQVESANKRLETVAKTRAGLIATRAKMLNEIASLRAKLLSVPGEMDEASGQKKPRFSPKEVDGMLEGQQALANQYAMDIERYDAQLREEADKAAAVMLPQRPTLDMPSSNQQQAPPPGPPMGPEQAPPAAEMPPEPAPPEAPDRQALLQAAQVEIGRMDDQALGFAVANAESLPPEVGQMVQQEFAARQQRGIQQPAKTAQAIPKVSKGTAALAKKWLPQPKTAEEFAAIPSGSLYLSTDIDPDTGEPIIKEKP